MEAVVSEDRSPDWLRRTYPCYEKRWVRSGRLGLPSFGGKSIIVVAGDKLRDLDVTPRRNLVGTW